MKVTYREDYILFDGEDEVEPGEMEPWLRCEVVEAERLISVDSSCQPDLTVEQAQRLIQWLSAAVRRLEPQTAANARRAARARRVLANACAEIDRESPVAQRDALTDLLADVMHWCRQENVSFDDSLRVARVHFEGEVAAETTQVTPDAAGGTGGNGG